MKITEAILIAIMAVIVIAAALNGIRIFQQL